MTTTMSVNISELSIPMPWGTLRGQIFGDSSNPLNRPLLALHGHLDNSNSFKPLAAVLVKRCSNCYVIALDYPGHGLSSHLPAGMPYSIKNILTTVRRVVRYLKLNRFILLAHSYGIVLSFLYDTIFRNEVDGIIAIDWVFSTEESKWKEPSFYWGLGIDGAIDAEEEIKKERIKKREKPLTHERALELLLAANVHIDEEAGKLLLERGLIEKKGDDKSGGKLEFTRDHYAKIAIRIADHYLDFMQMLPDIIEYGRAPILMLIAWPPSFNPDFYKNTMRIVDELKRNRPEQFELHRVEGTHHFHMMKSEETCDHIMKFLDKISSHIPTTNQQRSKL